MENHWKWRNTYWKS